MIKHVSLSLTIFLMLHSVSLSVECGAESISLQQANEHQSVSVGVLEIEEDLSIFARYGVIKDFITDKKQSVEHQWIKKQSRVTENNKKALICFALGVSPQTGFQSGFVSTDAIKLILNALSSSTNSVKNLLQWVYDISNNPMKGFEAWNKKKEIEAIYEGFPLLSESVLSFPAFVKAIKNKKAIENVNKESLKKIKDEQSNISQEIRSTKLTRSLGEKLEKYGNATLYFELGSLIHYRQITRDFNGQQISENDYCEVAAQYYREAIKRGGNAESYSNFAFLIFNGYTTKDANGNFILPEMRYEVAAQCYREAIKRGGNAGSYSNLGGLIFNGYTTKDEFGKSVSPEMRYEVAAQYYREAIKRGGNAGSYSNLGGLIQNGYTTKDEFGKSISPGTRYEVAAECYRKAIKKGDYASYKLLGFLIQGGDITKDEFGKSISPGTHYEVAAEYYRKAIKKGDNVSYRLLGFLIQHGYTTKDEFGKSISPGTHYEVAAECYRKVQKNNRDASVFLNLGIFISEDNTKKDIDGNLISAEKCSEVAAQYYREAIKIEQCGKAYWNLGLLIENHNINTDVNGQQISEENRYEVAAQCYRKAILYTDKNNSCGKAYWSLGVLIHDSEINTDINGQQISEENRYEVAAQCYRKAISQDKCSKAYYFLGSLIFEKKINIDLYNNVITTCAGRYEALAECYNLAIKNEEKKDNNIQKKTDIEIYSGNLAALYLLHDFNLSKEDRYKRIEDLSKKYGKEHSHILPLARDYFGRSQDGLEKWVDILIKNGCSFNQLKSKINIEKVLQKRDEESEISDKKTSDKKTSDKETSDQETSDNETSDNEIDTTISHDRHKGVLSDESKNDSSISVLSVDLDEDHVRKGIKTEEENEFENLKHRYIKRTEKISSPKPLSKREQIILENLKKLSPSAKKLDEQPKKTFYFTPTAAHQSEALKPKIKETFSELIDDIQKNGSKGRLKMLQNSEFEGLPVMTRKLTKGDRLAYTEKDGIVKVISLKGHYKQRCAAQNLDQSFQVGESHSWQKQLLDQGTEVFTKDMRGQEKKASSDIDTLHAKIGKPTLK